MDTINKICFFYECSYKGGTDTFVRNLINYWNLEDELTLICNRDHAGFEELKNSITHPNCTVESHDMPNRNSWMPKRKIKYFGFVLYTILNFILPFYYLLFSYKRLKLYRFDYLHVINGGYPAGLTSRCIPIAWCWNKGRKSIHNFHSLNDFNSFPISIVDSILDRLLILATSEFISVSSASAESIRERKVFRSLQNITYIYNGVSPEIVEAQFDLRKKLALNRNTKILIMLATYQALKGHKFIVDVFERVSRQIDEVHLIFMGYGSREEKDVVQKYVDVKHLDDRISCLDYTTRAMEYLSQADILLIGSQESESFGLTSVEAMKYHKVVVSTNVGGLKEVVKDGEGGFLFERDDVNGMSRQCVYLLSHPDEMLRQQELGYQRYLTNFTAPKVSEEYRRHLLSICL